MGPFETADFVNIKYVFIKLQLLSLSKKMYIKHYLKSNSSREIEAHCFEATIILLSRYEKNFQKCVVTQDISSLNDQERSGSWRFSV